MNLTVQALTRACKEALSSEHVQDLLASGGQLVDIRSAADFSRDSLPGSVNIPVASLGYGHRLLSREQPVIVYGVSEFLSSRAAHLLAGKGFLRIYHLGDS